MSLGRRTRSARRWLFGRGSPLGGQQGVQGPGRGHAGVLQAADLPVHLAVFLLDRLVRARLTRPIW